MALTFDTVVPGVPLINQLDSDTVDGLPDENARNNCVFACNAAMAQAYLHQPFYPDQIKDMDATYGQGYTGGAAEKYLLDTMLKLGITVKSWVSSTQNGLINVIHRAVHDGHAVLVTMPSNWDSAVAAAGAAWNPRAYRGPSHVGLACAVGGSPVAGTGRIRVMNPWGGFWHDGTDAYWAKRLLDGQVWEGILTGVPSMSIIPAGWKDDGTTLTAPNGTIVVSGFRNYVLGYPGGWEADNWPLTAEQHISPESLEPGNPTIGPGARQDFRYRSLGWTAARGTYRIWTGQDILALAKEAHDQQQIIAGDIEAFSEIRKLLPAE